MSNKTIFNFDIKNVINTYAGIVNEDIINNDIQNDLNNINNTSNFENKNNKLNQFEDNNKKIFYSKQELFESYFADFYKYIVDFRNGANDLKENGINNLDDFYSLLRTKNGDEAEFLQISFACSKYYLKSDPAGSLYDQKEEDGFVGYCMKHNMYVDETLFFQTFFSIFREEEEVGKEEYLKYFLYLPGASLMDICKYFYYTVDTLPKMFGKSSTTYKIIDLLPSRELNLILTSTSSVALNHSSFIMNENDRFGNKEDKAAIYFVDSKDNDKLRHNKIALTFDTGNNMDQTINILNILDRYKIKATFFLTLNVVKDYPDIIKEIIKRGHEIGNHSSTHPKFRDIDSLRRKLEVYKMHKYIKDLTGEDMHLFRFPYGAYNDECLKEIREMGYYPIQWNIDSQDWRLDGKDNIYIRVCGSGKIISGSIILFHNGPEDTVEVLPDIIKYIKNLGYSFARVSDIIYKNNFKIGTADGKQIDKSK